jgi:hypothetical protein
MPKRRNQHARTEPDSLGSLGCQGQHHPDVWALLRRVVEPRALVAELLRDCNVFGESSVVGVAQEMSMDDLLLEIALGATVVK